MPNKPPAYQHYAKDWLVGTAHLTLEQQGAYQRLLDHQWEDGPLPNDLGVLARMAGVSPARFRVIWGHLARHFPASAGGRLANRRLEDERKKQEAYREKQAKRATGKPRQRHGKAEPVAGTEPEASSSSSSSKGDEIPQTPFGAHAPRGPERVGAAASRLVGPAF